VSFLVFYLLFFAALLARRFLRGDLLRLSAGVAAGIFATVALLLGAVTLGKRHQVMSVRDAVVVSAVDGDQLNVFEGPGSQVRRFGLEEGARIQVLEQRRGWTKVRDDQGRDGWVAAGHIRRI
jgi:SH3-like domain-containing protein